MNEETLNAKAKKQIKLLLLCGAVLLLADYGLALFANTVPFYSSGSSIYMTRPASDSASGHIKLRADVESEDSDYSKSFDVTVKPYEASASQSISGSGDDAAAENAEDSMSREELVAFEVREIINSLNDDTSKKKVSLPSKLDTGESISWRVEKKTNTVLIAFLMMLLTVLIYKNRLAPLKKRQQAEQDSITRQLPEFINKLVLLLNAGLVLNTAFEKTVEESRRFNGNGEDYFYGQMQEIYVKVTETNGSMSREFRDFAKSRRGVSGDTAKELMRISNILSDNISKGVELTEKLQRESESLWLNRKRNCEERGRLAETKLTLPLTFFLLVLIVITVSPALLEL